MVDSFKGILYPARLPTFHRVPAPESVTNLVQWFWIPEWDIAPGHTSRQHVIAFPASAIFFTILAFNTLGNGVRDLLDPKQK